MIGLSQSRQVRREQTLYITLVDFLLQLLFLSVVFGAFAAASSSLSQNEHEQRAGLLAARVDELQIALTTLFSAAGTTNVHDVAALLKSHAANKETLRLAEIGRRWEETAQLAGGPENLKRLIEDQKRKGQFKPACRDNPARIVTFHAYADTITIERPLTNEFASLLAELGKDSSVAGSMSFAEFASTFRRVQALYPDCRFNVTVVEHTPLRQPRDVVREFFYVFNTEAK